MIEVINREILIPREEYNIGTCYDDNTETRHFHLKRVTSSGIDLAALTFNLDIKYANGQTDAASLLKEVTDKDINLTLTISNSMLQVPGTVIIQIRALEEDGTCKWTSYQSNFFVEDHINTPGHYQGDLTQLEQYEAEWGKVRDNVNQLNSRMDEVVKIHDDTPATEVEEEVIDGRVGYDGTQYDSLGTAVRQQIIDVREDMEEDTTDWTEALAAETTARTTQDRLLQSQIDQIIAPSGEAPSAAEVQNARIGADGVTYATLGEAIRTQDAYLKSTFDKCTGNVIILTTVGGYINLSGNTTDYAVVANSYMKYAIVDCEEGDSFTINSSGGNSSRAYAFVDTNGTILQVAAVNQQLTDETVTAPARTVKLVINGYKTDADSYYGELLAAQVKKNSAKLNQPTTINEIDNDLRNILGIGKMSKDISASLTTETGYFYNEGTKTTLANAKTYKLDCTDIDLIYFDRITPAWYDVVTLVDENDATIEYKRNPTSVSIVRNKYALDVTKAKYAYFSDDTYDHFIKVFGISSEPYKTAYTKNLSDSRLIQYIGDKFYANGIKDSSPNYQYYEYNVMGYDTVKITTSANEWTDIYDLIDKDGNVIDYELTQTAGVFSRILDVSNACEIRMSVLKTKAGTTRVYAIDDGVTDIPYRKFAVIGDSWVEYNSTNTENFIDYSCKDLCADWVNYGVSGTGYKATEGNGTAFYQRAETVDLTNCDAVILFGSGNDNTEIASGHLGESTDQTSDTVCGCVNLTIDKIIERYPLIKIGIISPAPWESMNNNTDNNFKRYSAKLAEIAALHGLPFLDLYSCSNLRPWDATQKATLQPDGCHPNNAGHKYIYPIVRDFIQGIIQ